MLIIRRRRGESITIGDDVEIEILEATPTQVKLGIRAPRTISVLRKEIYLTRDFNRAASGAPTEPEKLNALAERLRQSNSPITGLPSATSSLTDGDLP